MGKKLRRLSYIKNLKVFTENFFKRTASYFKLESCESGLLYDSA